MDLAEAVRRNKISILIVGSGGREHALAWKAKQSPLVNRVFVAPGNGGTTENSVAINPTEIDRLADFAAREECLTIVGPEIPLSLGIVDRFSELGLPIFGPTMENAKLETSKSFAKKLMRENNIPTATFEYFEDTDRAIEYARKLLGRVAVKADGLASGKGVFVCSNEDQAEEAIKAILERKVFGEAGKSVVVEEKLVGREISLMSLCDGKSAVPFGVATDHKRLTNGDKGPNTGGMGAYSPSVRFGPEQVSSAMEKVILPVVRKTGYRGFLYAGLMLTEDGPKVLEFNARLGDPETQALLPRLRSDLIEAILPALGEGTGSISDVKIEWIDSFSCSVAMCSEGYPESLKTGDEIFGIERAQNRENTVIFHSGTKKTDGKFFTNGGRVLYVTSIGATLEEASRAAYDSVALISWRGEYHRTDIGRAEKESS